MSYQGKNEFRDEIGNRFGRLVVQKRVENRIAKSGKPYVRYLCKCDCGNFHEADVSGLRAGNVKSCGCFAKENLVKNFHGLNNKWNGGKSKTSQGYINVYKPDHPAQKGVYVLEHRLVVEEHIGRYLLETERVHHKNGIKTDNRIENLELWTSEHPKGSRVEDLTEFAVRHLKQYAPEKLK